MVALAPSFHFLARLVMDALVVSLAPVAAASAGLVQCNTGWLPLQRKHLCL